MKILGFKGTNFGPFESVEYNFTDEVIALTGDNKTQEDQASNGAGKSFIMQIIYYAISGNNLRGVIDKKLVRNGCEEGSSSIRIECPLRKETLSISRTLSAKYSSKLAILNNGEPVSFATVNDGNKYIVDWIGISPEDLKSYFIICKEFYKSFFKASNTEKLALISRFINFSYIDKTKDVIDKDILELNNSKRELEKSKNVLEGKLEVYEANYLKEESRDLEKEKQDIITRLQEQIISLKQEVETFNRQNNEDEDEVALIRKEADKFKNALTEAEALLKKAGDTEEYDETLSAIRETLAELKAEEAEWAKKAKEIDNSKQEIKKLLQRIEVNISGVIECPKCKHKFLSREDTTLEEEEEKKVGLNRKDRLLGIEQSKVELKIVEFNDTISEYLSIKKETEESREVVAQKKRNLESSVSKVSRDLDIREGQISQILRRITSRNATIEGRKARIEGFESQILDTQAQELKIDVEELEKNIQETAEAINLKEVSIAEFDSQIFAKSQWVNRFKDFKRYMALDQLKNIQYHANEILKKQKSDLRLLLEGFKLDSKGKAKEEITPYVLREEAENFWYYSGGERARVEIAVIIAFQQMINLTNPYGGLEFLFIDEITEGLSEEGLYNVIEALAFMKQPILITTHVSNQSVKCKALKVEKINDISRIV